MSNLESETPRQAIMREIAAYGTFNRLLTGARMRGDAAEELEYSRRRHECLMGISDLLDTLAK